MRIILLFLFAVFSFGFKVNITKVTNTTAYLEKNVQKGISGIVVCPYKNTKIICARAVSYGNKAKLYAYKELKNSAFALPFVYPKAGDKIIFAKNYKRILIIAPNQSTYLKIKQTYSDNTIISPDILATFLNGDISRKRLVNFAKTLDIGKYIIAYGGKIYETDALSFYAVNEKNFKTPAYKKAFFTYIRNFDIKKTDYLKYLRGLND